MTSTQSSVLAGPPGDCCFKGVKHFGEPSGETITIAGVQTYISKPPPAKDSSHDKKIILYLADVYGPLYINAQLLQDYYASHGFTVLGIDYFFGDPIHLHTEESFGRAAWMAKSKQQAKEAFPKWIKEVRETYGANAKYFAVGYCFGAPFTLELASTNDIVAAAFAHPAFLTEDHFKQITKPLLLSCAETDHTFPKESRRRAEDILEEVKATDHVQIFSGVAHGFGTRGDPDVENSRWAKEKSAQGVIEWFIRFS